MPADSYMTLAHNQRHLKGAGEPAPTPDMGITQADLLDAERQAKNAIDGWLLAVCGAVAGAAIIAEFTAAAPTAIDPEIADLADLHASAVVWEWYEARNFGNVSRAEAPNSRAEMLKTRALYVAERIETAGKTVKADGTVRRLRYSKWEQGPAAGGPLTGKTYFPTPTDLEPGPVPTDW